MITMRAAESKEGDNSFSTGFRVGDSTSRLREIREKRQSNFKLMSARGVVPGMSRLNRKTIVRRLIVEWNEYEAAGTHNNYVLQPTETSRGLY